MGRSRRRREEISSYLDEQKQVGILRLGGRPVLVLPVLVLKINTLRMTKEMAAGSAFRFKSIHLHPQRQVPSHSPARHRPCPTNQGVR